MTEDRIIEFGMRNAEVGMFAHRAKSIEFRRQMTEFRKSECGSRKLASQMVKVRALMGTAVRVLD